MGKRSDFERIPRDFYPTPKKAVRPLARHLPDQFSFVEPCAGDGRLVEHLNSYGGYCKWASDIEPQHEFVMKANAFDIEQKAQFTITNPPWDRKILHPMIWHFSNINPTWLLFDADWIHTKQSNPFLTRLKKIVSIGRVKWIEDSNSVGKDNCCWYLFDNKDMVKPIEFWGRDDI